MKQSKAFVCTLREAPGDAEVPSHRLLAQAGFIQKLSAGVYCYTPAMWRVLRKVAQIVREEMDRAGAQEVMLPILQPQEIWQRSGRLSTYVTDGIMFHFKDRKDFPVCLGPTHEEVITLLADKFVNSYKQLPLNLYQIQTKFRDEIRPRFGLMRCREFIMKDAYSFDVDDAGLDVSYQAMREAYSRAFERCGFAFGIAQADSGAIGGAASEEFIVPAETGEDLFLICDAAKYAANQERAVSVVASAANATEQLLPLEKVATPNTTTIEELRKFFGDLEADRCVKAVMYHAIYAEREEVVIALIRGDQEINEVKLKNELGALGLQLANDEEIRTTTGAVPGFTGPIGLAAGVKVVADKTVAEMKNVVFGANETDFHYRNANLGRDFELDEFVDIRLARDGELCVLSEFEGRSLTDEERRLKATRGIEVGHIFKLGTKYSAAMGATVKGEDGKDYPFVMGCYGIGISRVAAAAIEQCHDEQGMIWPLAIAPWQVQLVCMNPKKDEQKALADSVYQQLLDAGVEVLYDERPVSPGIKFNDADLIGVPLRIVVGKFAADGEVEFTTRANLATKEKLPVAEALKRVDALLQSAGLQ